MNTKRKITTNEKRSDIEYLGGNEDVREAEGWEDVVIDAPLKVDPHRRYVLRELTAQCPLGVYAWLVRDRIFCLNPKAMNVLFFDPVTEKWIENSSKPFKYPETKPPKELQCGPLGPNHFYLWARKNLDSPGTIGIYDNEDITLIQTLNMNLKPSYWRYGRLFSIGKNLMLQSRYRFERDNRLTLWRSSLVDGEMIHIHNIFDKNIQYSLDSFYSSLFYFNFEEDTWKMVDTKGSSIPVSMGMAKTPDEKNIYFLSRIHQGYQLDTENWRSKPLHLIGRPKTVSMGSTLIMKEEENLIFSIGGASKDFILKPMRLYYRLLRNYLRLGKKKKGKLLNLSVEDEAKIYKGTASSITLKRSKKTLSSKITYFKDIILLDLKKNKWFIPTISGDYEWWENVGFSSVIQFQDKIFIIGGKNQNGDLDKMWVLETDKTPLPPEEKKEKKNPEQKENEPEKTQEKAPTQN